MRNSPGTGLNNRKLFLAVLVFAAFLIPFPARAELSCTVRQNICLAGEANVFHMYNLSNAHAEMPSQNNYQYRVCCGGVPDLSTDCSGGSVLLNLYSQSNSHVEKGTLTTYENKACLKLSGGEITCGYVDAPSECASLGSGYTCLAALSGNTNAHISSCTETNAYNIKLCCKYTDTTPPAGDVRNESSSWSTPAWVKSNNLTLNCSDTISGCRSEVSYGFVENQGSCNSAASLPQSTSSGFLMAGQGGGAGATGNHNDFLCIRVFDNAGNPATAISDQLMVDVTAPSTTDDVDTAKWYGNDIQIKFTCSDAMSGCRKISYCITDEGQSCTPSKEIAASGGTFESLVTENVSCGQASCSKKVMYQSEDTAGNVETVKAKAPIMIDAAIPTCIMNSPNKQYTAILDIPVSWEADAQGGSPITSIQLQKSMDNEEFSNWSAETSPTGTKTFTGENGHKYYFRCRAANVMGTASGWSSSASITIDTDAPAVQISVNSTLVNATSFSLNWSTDEPGSVVNYTIYYKEGSDPYTLWKVFTSGNSALFGQDGNPSLKNNFTYTLKMNITDRAGNTRESSEVQVKIDTGKPNCTIQSLAAYQPSSSFAVNWSGADGESGIQSGKYILWVRNGSNSWAAYRNLGTSKGMTGMADGIYRFKCAAMDTAGNTGDNSTEKNTTVDINPPQISPAFNDSVDQGQNLTVNATVADSIRISSVVLSYGGSIIIPVSNSTNPNQSVWDVTWTISNLTAGQKSFTITVTDMNGNSNSTEYGFLVKLCDEGTTKKCGPCASGETVCANGVWGACAGANLTLIRPETCNGMDDNCDGIIDNINNSIDPQATHCACTYQPASKIPEIQAQQETCNGTDDNCNGQIDENGGCCTEGRTQSCGTDIGICRNKKKTCTDQRWGPCEWEIGPSPQGEICNNGKDDNCNGQVDEGCIPCTDTDGDGYGNPASNLCAYPEQDCDDSDPNINSGMPEACNGKDDDCNGQADDGLACDHCMNGVQDADEEGADCGGADCQACFVWGWLFLTAGGIVILIILAFVWLHMRKQGRELTWEELKKKWTT